MYSFVADVLNVEQCDASVLEHLFCNERKFRELSSILQNHVRSVAVDAVARANSFSTGEKNVLVRLCDCSSSFSAMRRLVLELAPCDKVKLDLDEIW